MNIELWIGWGGSFLVILYLISFGLASANVFRDPCWAEIFFLAAGVELNRRGYGHGCTPSVANRQAADAMAGPIPKLDPPFEDDDILGLADLLGADMSVEDTDVARDTPS